MSSATEPCFKSKDTLCVLWRDARLAPDTTAMQIMISEAFSMGLSVCLRLGWLEFPFKDKLLLGKAVGNLACLQKEDHIMSIQYKLCAWKLTASFQRFVRRQRCGGCGIVKSVLVR